MLESVVPSETSVVVDSTTSDGASALVSVAIPARSVGKTV